MRERFACGNKVGRGDKTPYNLTFTIRYNEKIKANDFKTNDLPSASQAAYEKPVNESYSSATSSSPPLTSHSSISLPIPEYSIKVKTNELQVRYRVFR